MKNRKRDRQVFEALTMVLQLGITMLVSIGMCTAFGIWLGKRTGIDWMMVPFFFLGALAGGTSVYRMTQRFLHHGKRDVRDAKKTK